MFQLSFHRSFQVSNLWKPELRFTSPVVEGRRYRVHHTDGVLTVVRTFNDFLDFFFLAQHERWCIAKGPITWEGTTAHVDLKIGLKTFPLFVFWVMQLFLLAFLVLLFCLEWQVAILASFALIGISLASWAYCRFVVKRFLEDLAYDMERFREDESTRWHEVH